jgi:hypothetical protein
LERLPDRRHPRTLKLSTLDSQSSSVRFEEHAQADHFADSLKADFRDKDATMRDDFDQTAVGQEPQRLANRATRHVKPLCKGNLREVAASRELTTRNLIGQRSSDRGGERLGPSHRPDPPKRMIVGQ